MYKGGENLFLNGPVLENLISRLVYKGAYLHYRGPCTSENWPTISEPV